MHRSYYTISCHLSGKGIPVRHILGKSKVILGLLEGLPTMQKGEVSMVLFVTSSNYNLIDKFLNLCWSPSCVIDAISSICCLKFEALSGSIPPTNPGVGTKEKRQYKG